MLNSILRLNYAQFVKLKSGDPQLAAMQRSGERNRTPANVPVNPGQPDLVKDCRVSKQPDNRRCAWLEPTACNRGIPLLDEP
jgi:hypothetical protein